MDQVVEVKGVKLLAAKVEGVDMNGLRDLGDQLKEEDRRRCCCSCSCKRRAKKTFLPWQQILHRKLVLMQET